MHYSTKFRNMVRLVIKCLSNKVWDVFLVLKTVKSLLTLISGTCQWSNFSYNNYMIYRYFLNLYRFTDKNLILKCHFNGYFRIFLSSMKKRVREVEKLLF